MEIVDLDIIEPHVLQTVPALNNDTVVRLTYRENKLKRVGPCFVVHCLNSAERERILYAVVGEGFLEE